MKQPKPSIRGTARPESEWPAARGVPTKPDRRRKCAYCGERGADFVEQAGRLGVRSVHLRCLQAQHAPDAANLDPGP